MTIPKWFLWTKMNTDGGEPLENIIRRKELERQAGTGRFRNIFWWGVGESKGPAIKELVKKACCPEILFSKTLGSVQNRDKEGGYLWQYYYCESTGKSVPIPEYAIVHSRPNPYSPYYAIVCRSRSPLERPRGRKFCLSNLRNLNNDGKIGKIPGHSQNTTVVRHKKTNKQKSSANYHDDMRADLVVPYFVMLTCPRKLTEREYEQLRGIGADGETVEDYRSVARKIRRRS